MKNLEEFGFQVENLDIHLRFYREDGIQAIFDYFKSEIDAGDDSDKERVLVNVGRKMRSILSSNYMTSTETKRNRDLKFIDKLFNINTLFNTNEFIMNHLNEVQNSLYIEWFSNRNKLKVKEFSKFKDLVKSIKDMDNSTQFKRFLYDNDKTSDCGAGALKYMTIFQKHGLLTGEILHKLSIASGLSHKGFFESCSHLLDEAHIEYLQKSIRYNIFKVVLETISDKKKDNFLEKIFNKNEHNIFLCVYSSHKLMKFLVDNKYEDFLFKGFEIRNLKSKKNENTEKLIDFYSQYRNESELFHELNNRNILSDVEKSKIVSPVVKNFILQNKLSSDGEKRGNKMKI